MHSHTRRRSGLSAIAASAALLTLLAGCATNESGDIDSDLSGTLDGAGSSAQSAAQDVWIAGFQRNNARVTVDYDPTGSGAGREQFIAGGVDFAGSDSALSDEELAEEFAGCAPGSSAIDIPVYLSPLVLIYNIEGVDSLQLDATTIAGIFSNTITRWNDPAIVALNPDSTMPNVAITAVHRSDDSGTTRNFTDYLHQNAPTVWVPEAADTFAYGGAEAAQGNSGVVNAVSGGVNAIGYADASRVGDLDVAALKVGDSFVEYSADAAAAIIDESPLVSRDNPNDLVVDVDRTSTVAGVYPLVLVSYLIACEQYSDPEVAELVKAYVSWVSSAEGQAAAASGAGSAPLSAEFSERVLTAIASIR